MKLRNYIHNLPSLKGNLIYVDWINLDVDVKLENADSFNIWSSDGMAPVFNYLSLTQITVARDQQVLLNLSTNFQLIVTARYNNKGKLIFNDNIFTQFRVFQTISNLLFIYLMKSWKGMSTS